MQIIKMGRARGTELICNSVHVELGRIWNGTAAPSVLGTGAVNEVLLKKNFHSLVDNVRGEVSKE